MGYCKPYIFAHLLSILGNALGINNLGYCCRNGIGTSVDKQKAVELYQKAADLGYVLYYFGEIILINTLKQHLAYGRQYYYQGSSKAVFDHVIFHINYVTNRGVTNKFL